MYHFLFIEITCLSSFFFIKHIVILKYSYIRGPLSLVSPGTHKISGLALPPSRDPSSTAHTLPVKIEQFPLPLVYRFVFCCMFCWGVYGFGGEVFWICLLALWLLMDLGWWSSLWCLWLLFWYWGCWANNKNTILLLYMVL